MSKTTGIAAKVRALIEGPITEAGYLLWEVNFAKEGPDDTLFVAIDSPNGIGLSDCERVTKLIDPILDEADPIAQSYYLEVSSAGSERVLKEPMHFERFLGSKVTATLYAPLSDGRKEVCGVLSSYEPDAIVIDDTRLDKATYSMVKTVDVTAE